MKHNLTIFGLTFSFNNKKLTGKGKNIALDSSEVKSEVNSKPHTDLENEDLAPFSVRDISIPAWKKDIQGRMIWLNQPYEDSFLKPMGLSMKDYIGKKDRFIWGKRIANAFRKHDLVCMMENGFSVMREPIIVDDKDAQENWLIVKFRTLDKNGDVSGIAGMAIPVMNKDGKDADLFEQLIRNGFWDTDKANVIGV